MFITVKPSQRLGAVPTDPRICDLLSGTGTPAEKFLPIPLSDSIIHCYLNVISSSLGYRYTKQKPLE